VLDITKDFPFFDGLIILKFEIKRTDVIINNIEYIKNGISARKIKITKIAPIVMGRPKYSSEFNALNRESRNNPDIR
jgi:hypothetical protein